MSRAARILIVVALFIAVLSAIWLLGPRTPAGPERSAVVTQYADLAHAVYADSLTAARGLSRQIDALLADPSRESLDAARQAWRAARVPYMQSEVFRFGNPPVDAWEGQVNAWPLDEGLIDYVANGYVHEQGNPAAQANLIANTRLQVGSREIDAAALRPALLADINELAGSEANVATGYHAIEFLLWGQDLNGTGPGAGQRPHSDYLSGEGCTDGSEDAPARHCQRRGEYLRSATDLLLADLEEMVAQWAPGNADNYRARLLALPEREALRRMLFGMGSLALGELAGERMKVALLANSTEDEHDCFSDNTHFSHYYNALGIANIYRGHYQRLDGSISAGPGIKALLQARAPEVAEDMGAGLDTALMRLQAIVNAAENGEHFDQMIAAGNGEGRERIQQAIDALVALAQDIQQAAYAIGVDKLQPETAGHQF